jgi:hypothetical protein
MRGVDSSQQKVTIRPPPTRRPLQRPRGHDLRPSRDRHERREEQSQMASLHRRLFRPPAQDSGNQISVDEVSGRNCRSGEPASRGAPDTVAPAARLRGQGHGAYRARRDQSCDLAGY